MKRIEQYDNYRTFLNDYITEQKARFSYFSNRYFCRKAGIKSPSLCAEVIDGKRNLTEATINAFAKGMGLTDRDGEYFRLLVHYNQSKTIDEQTLFLTELKKFRRKTVTETIPVDHFGYFEHWYNPALRELACLARWNGDYDLLGRLLTPQISAAAARRGVELLLKMGYIAPNEDGTYRQTTPALVTGNNVVGVRGLNRQMGELGIASIENVPVSERYVSSMTVGVSEKTYHALEKEIESFKDRLRSIVDEDDRADRVYNVNIHLFPLSRKVPDHE